MNKLRFKPIKADVSIELPSSKSISNRLLIMQALASNGFKIRGLSKSDDTQILQKALQSNSRKLNVGPAGTAFRFLTAYLCLKQRTVELKGSERMHQRPIKPLVEALQKLGAQISYLEKDGFPPISIESGELKGGKIAVDASLSSQFVTAILLISPYLKGGLKLQMENATSLPYVKMTMELMRRLGIGIHQQSKVISIDSGDYHLENAIEVEADWSSAAFFYQAFLFSEMDSMEIIRLSKQSIQGDSACAEYFYRLGIKSSFQKGKVRLSKTEEKDDLIRLNMKDHPDLILPFAVAAAFKAEKVQIEGIETLRNKESDRVSALKNELQKFGDFHFEAYEHYLVIQRKELFTIESSIAIDSYDDHRVMMAFAPLALSFSNLQVDEPGVVSKSFPGFWEELAKLGVELEK